MKKNKILAILTGGGDTPALNASIEAIRNRAISLGYNVYGICKGWKGLLGDGEIVDLTHTPINGKFGGTIIKSSRTNPFSGKDPNRVDQVINNIKKYKIDVLVTIGGDDTNGAAKLLYEKIGIPVIGFPKTIDNDLRTKTYHIYNSEKIEAVLCPGFPTAAQTVAKLVNNLHTTAKSHARTMVVEIMGRDAGWLTGAALFGNAHMFLIPEVPITKEKKKEFFEKVKKNLEKNKDKYLIIAVAEGVRWYDEKTDKVDVVYASSETDEFGHPRFGGVSGVIASEISKNLGIEARSQILGYLARSGNCSNYDFKLCNILADKLLELLVNENYGKMTTLSEIVNYNELDYFKTSAIEMGNIGNISLPLIYYSESDFTFNEKYYDFLSKFIEKPENVLFDIELKKVII